MRSRRRRILTWWRQLGFDKQEDVIVFMLMHERLRKVIGQEIARYLHQEFPALYTKTTEAGKDQLVIELLLAALKKTNTPTASVP